MERAPHFVQAVGRPVLIGQGTGVLNCRCGRSELVRGYDPRCFLAVDFQCAACGEITTTPGLSALSQPPAVITPLDRNAITPAAGSAIPPGHVLAGREELDRLMYLYQPRGPVSDTVSVTDAWLDSISADYDRLTGGLLAAHLKDVAAAEAIKPLSGFAKHSLAWALHSLRDAIRDPAWECIGSDTASVATTLTAAFRYFTDCWSHHPLFPQMVAAVGDTGFALPATSVFAAAKSLSDSGNRIAFLPPQDGSERVRDFVLAMGPTDRLACVADVFDRFSWPTGRTRWDSEDLQAAVLERLLASRNRISQRRPGMILLCPGPTREEMEQPLVDAIIAAFRSYGRRYRHVSAVAVVMPKIMATSRDTARFGYSFLPIANPRHSAVTVAVAGGSGATG